MWNLGTAVNRSELEEIKSIRLRDNLKIHQQQTGYMVTSLKFMRNSNFAVVNIISEHRSISKKKPRWSIFKDIFKIIFFMLQETIPLYLACDKVLIIKASVRVTSPVNKFEALSNTTRWRRNAIPQC